MENKLPKRKNIRLEDFDYSSAGAYFITICAENGKNYFWEKDTLPEKVNWQYVGANCVRPQGLPLSKIGETVLNEFGKWEETYDCVTIPAYVIMPNHLHVMIAISGDEFGRTQFAPTLNRMIKQFKGSVSKKVGKSIWQKSFMEHVIRNEKDFLVKFNYIMENPLKLYYKEK